MDEPIGYARSGDLHIAYTEAGDGPVDLFYVPTWISAVEVFMEEPSLAAFVERLCSFARVVSFDRRGAGLSDPWVGLPTLEDQMDDVLAVMEATGTERASLMGTLEGGPLAMLFAATHPDRVESLILYETYARTRWAPDYDWPPHDDERDARVREIVAQWGEGGVVAALAPSMAEDPDFLRWAGRMERYSTSPGTADAVLTALGETDIRHVLPSIRVPTLVMHRRDDQFLFVEHARYLAQHIPNARYVELEGTDAMFSIGDSEAISRRDRGVPHRRAARPGAGSRARNGPVHRHLRLDRARGRARRLRLALAARAPRRARARRGRPSPRQSRQVDRRRRPGHL